MCTPSCHRGRTQSDSGIGAETRCRGGYFVADDQLKSNLEVDPAPARTARSVGRHRGGRPSGARALAKGSSSVNVRWTCTCQCWMEFGLTESIRREEAKLDLPRSGLDSRYG